MIGVALISVTLVPALIPTFIKGRLRGEEENWIVRSFIDIYKPLLTWALPRRNLVMWTFAALLILAAGMFPLQAVFGMGARDHDWEIAFFVVLAVVIVADGGLHRRAGTGRLVSFVSLVLLGLVAYHFPKIGVEFMPALDEGRRPGHADHGAAGQRHRGGRRSQGPRRPAAAVSRGRVGRSARRAGPTRRPTRPRWTWSRRSSTSGPRNCGRKRVLRLRRRGPADAAGAGGAGAAGLSSAPADADDRDALINDADDEGADAVRRDDARAGPAALPGIRARAGPAADALRRRGDAAPLPCGRLAPLAARR